MLRAATPGPFLDSLPVSAAVAVPYADSAGISSVVVVVLSTSVLSSASTPSASASAISSWRPPPSPPSAALALGPSKVLIAYVVGPAVIVVHPAGSLILLSCASLVASAFFAHLLLNVMWFSWQLGHFFCVWPQREPCFAMYPTILYLLVLVWCGPEQSPHVGLPLHLLSMWP